MYMQGFVSFGSISERNTCPHSTDRNCGQSEKYLVNIVHLKGPLLIFSWKEWLQYLCQELLKGRKWHDLCLLQCIRSFILKTLGISTDT
jgi:hypothetical protein